MATIPRDNAPCKDKKLPSSSHTPPTPAMAHRKTGPNPSKSRLPSAHSQDPAGSEKQARAYLKPTLTSPNDVVSKQQGKKPAPTDSAHRPGPARRRSFDTPPPPSHTQNAMISPNPRPRSHSVSSKPASSHKYVADQRHSRAKEGGKQSYLSGKPVKKIRTIYVEKKKKPAPGADDVPQPETQVKEPECLVKTDVPEKEIHVEGTVETKTDVLEPVGLEQTESQSEEKDIHIETAEPETISPGVEADEEEDRAEIKEALSNNQELSECDLNELNSSQSDEKISSISMAEVENEDEEHVETESEKKEEAEEETGGEVHESKAVEVAEVVEVAAEEKKQEAGSKAAKVQVVLGRRDSAVSNDVIEETASKLLEQRKNKVRALAGAFETVISLQDPK